MATIGETSRSNGNGDTTTTTPTPTPSPTPTADSYIGSLISLISKSEIRYEGLLYNINTAESSIGLRNVKSFGTEGRKKDGPQVPPSDKVYEYILFRGNDIKDLQVKSSQPVESTSSLYNDPAIIQSHYSQGAATSTSSQTLQTELPKSGLQGGLPLYQPSPISGSWGLTPVPPITNSSSFPMPMYMQGFYGASEGIQASHQSFLQPPTGLSIPPSMQQYQVNNTSIPSRTSTFSASPFSVSTASLLPPLGVGPLNSNLMSPSQSSALFSDSSTTLISNKALTQSHPTTASYSSLPLASPSDVSDRSIFSTSVPDKLENVAGLSMPYDTGFKPQSSDAGASDSLLNRGSAPLLVTPNQLLQPGSTANGLLRPGATLNGFLQPLPATNQVLQLGHMPNQDLQLGNTASQVLQPKPTSSQAFQPGPNSNQFLQTGITTSSLNYSSDSAQKDVEVVQAPSTERPQTTQNETQAPLLPLPLQHDYKVNGYHSYARNNSRGGARDRLRGHGGSRQVTRFTEEFDFTAMNEKFKKDEIWGDLGKSNTSSEEGSPDKEHAGNSNMEFKPVYVKDDFFDSLSCNVSDRGLKNGRTNFSEQRKLDVETFGNYARHRGGHGHNHGGRGYGHGGQGYNRGGRGYGSSNGHGYVGNNARGYVGGNARGGYGGNGGRGYNGYDRSYGYSGRGYGHHAT